MKKRKENDNEIILKSEDRKKISKIVEELLNKSNKKEFLFGKL